MSKLLDLLDRIREGAPAPMGFGVTRPVRLPGMALIGLVSQDYAKGMAVVAELSLDAAMVAGADGPEGVKQAGEGLMDKPWGARVTSLSQDEAQAYQDNGSDLLVFPLEGTAASALANEEIARILCIEPNMEDRELRAVSSLPVDCFLLPLSQAGDSLTLSDLAAVGSISRRSDKYILLEISRPPNGKDLEALRDIGVQGLVMDVAAVPAESLKELKAALMEMPRQTFKRKGRTLAILPGSGFSPASEPEPQEEEEEEEDGE